MCSELLEMALHAAKQAVGFAYDGEAEGDIEPMALVLAPRGEDGVEIHPFSLAGLFDESLESVLGGDSAPPSHQEVDARFGVVVSALSGALKAEAAAVLVPVWSYESTSPDQDDHILRIIEEKGSMDGVPGTGEAVLFVFVAPEGVTAYVARLARVGGTTVVGRWMRHEGRDVVIPWTEEVQKQLSQ